MALIKGLMAFVLGAALALGLWFIGLIARLRVPAWIRWAGSAMLVALHLYYFRRPVTRPAASTEANDPIWDFYLSVGAPYDGNAGWDAWQYGMNLFCIGLALLVLVVIGIFVSLTKTAVRTVAKVASGASKSEMPAPPPLPPVV